MAASIPLQLAYYGDDFTGSTDALEYLSRAGLRTALFIAPPDATQLAAMPGLQAVGVAGLTRALAPAAMKAVLRPTFEALRALGPRHVHYKVCSTFDSSPEIGSIGCAIAVGRDVFGGAFVPLLVGAPALGRYCVFGNLFARLGIGSAGEIHRLDRHPSMCRHPVTPADEADLRRHLARQTDLRIGLMDVLALALPRTQAQAALRKIAADGAEVVLLDVLSEAHLATLGALIDGAAEAGQGPLFSVGSSGVEMALGAFGAETGQWQPRTQWVEPGQAEPLLVVSGSCSPVTTGQIDWALARDFTGVALDPMAPDEGAVGEAVGQALRAGRSVVVFTSRGPATGAMASAEVVGGALGRVARAAVAETGVRRLVIAGGDTSSYAARALGITAVEMIAPLAPGAPLVRALAPGSPADGLELNFKGGQVGARDYFGAVQQGRLE